MTDPAITTRSPWRHLRLATSAISFAACVLSIVLWVRSYWWLDFGSYDFSNTSGVRAISRQGQLRIIVGWNVSILQAIDKSSVSYQIFGETFALPNTPHRIPAEWPAQRSVLREFQWTRYPTGLKIIVPHWFWAAVCGAAGSVPWIRRFSLRAMLIAMTLIAILLGIVFIAR